MKDQRRAKRYPAKFFANIRSFFDKSVLGRGVVVDVSVVGIAIETETELRTGETYECDVEIPLRLKTKLVRSQTTGQIKRYGFEIIDQRFMDKLLLKMLLQGQKQTIRV